MSDASGEACRSCAALRAPDPAPRLRLAETSSWVVAHAFDACLEGWLVVLPRRHVEALDELDRDELAQLGPLLGAVTAALRQVTGCQKTYVVLMAEAKGFPHVHFHVVPRAADLDERFRGARIFGLLGGSEEFSEVAAERQDALALELRAILVERGEASAPSVAG